MALVAVNMALSTIQPPVPAGNGQGEQERAQRDDSNKADADDLGRGAQSQLSPPNRPLVPQPFADIFIFSIASSLRSTQPLCIPL
ncbi:MAG: hypothetical protein ACLVJH_15905 [Faecalibacterium prausnitzii]